MGPPPPAGRSAGLLRRGFGGPDVGGGWLPALPRFAALLVGFRRKVGSDHFTLRCHRQVRFWPCSLSQLRKPAPACWKKNATAFRTRASWCPASHPPDGEELLHGGKNEIETPSPRIPCRLSREFFSPRKLFPEPSCQRPLVRYRKPKIRRDPAAPARLPEKCPCIRRR